MNDKVNELGRRIRSKLGQLRQQIKAGNESQLAIWVIPGQLACSQRPLRDHLLFGGRGRPLPPEAREAVVGWVERMKGEYGIRSIICLMHSKELKYYDELQLDPRGLVGFYERMGFGLCHLPWPDPAHAKSPEERIALMRRVEEIKMQALQAFDELEKPVLLHCSAAIDRTTPVAAFIVCRRG